MMIRIELVRSKMNIKDMRERERYTGELGNGKTYVQVKYCVDVDVWDDRDRVSCVEIQIVFQVFLALGDGGESSRNCSTLT